MEIGNWLKNLGLDQYEDKFRESGIDTDVLSELSDEHLKDLGLPLGHRLKMLRAIRALGNERALHSPPADTAREAVAPEETAERRQLTVLFADLVGSTQLSGRLDPEALSAVLKAYQNTVAGEIARLGGHVAKFMGDGVLAYFGWPIMHEDEAERAIRAGLAIVQAVKRLATPAGEPLSCRVGIATGLVVVGERIGEGSSREEAVVGETPNLAARLQSLAKPGSVLIASGTRTLVGGLFELEDLGAQSLKGFDQPTLAWRVIGEYSADRFKALRGRTALPLVGRGRELTELLGLWEQAKTGEGRGVLITGEAGIGKSRLLQGLRERLDDSTYSQLRLHCTPHAANSPLYPFITEIERLTEIKRDDTGLEKLRKLEASLVPLASLNEEELWLLSNMLSIDQPAPHQELTTSPQRRRAMLVAVLSALSVRFAVRQPLLITIEDIHWCDPSSIEVITAILAAVHDKTAFVIMTSRPGFASPWEGLDHVLAMPLSRLSRKEVSKMVDGVARGRPLPAEVLEQILIRTDGVPLFAEELTLTILESGLLQQEGGRLELRGKLPPNAIPSSLHDSLLARLDRFAPVKGTAQVGSALGREFSYELLSAVSPLTEIELKRALDQLVQAELINVRGTPPQAVFSFKHALVRDAAYESMLKSTRSKLHATIARVLEQHFREMIEASPELAAHHYTEAGLIDPAVSYWKLAGERAAAKSANAEAIAHIKRGLGLVQLLPASRSRAERELSLLNALASPVMNTQGYAAPEAVDIYDRSYALCREVGESNSIFQALAGVSTYHMVRGEVRRAMTSAEEMLSLAEKQDQLGPIIESHRLIGLHAWTIGELEMSVHHFELVERMFDPAQRQKWALQYGQDQLMSSMALRTWSLAALGRIEEALRDLDRSAKEAKVTGHIFSLAYALTVPQLSLYYLGDAERIVAVAPRAISLCTEQGIPFYRAFSEICLGWAKARTGAPREGVASMRSGLDGWRATGAKVALSGFTLMLAEGLLQLGEAVEARTLVEESLGVADETGECHALSDGWRMMGRLHLAKQEPNFDSAKDAFSKAGDVARSQGARIWELKSAVELAMLHLNKNRVAEARELLSPIYSALAHERHVGILQEAAALMSALRSS
jgi:class 3 adenylate cyclase/predicted ATPase